MCSTHDHEDMTQTALMKTIRANPENVPAYFRQVLYHELVRFVDRDNWRKRVELHGKMDGVVERHHCGWYSWADRQRFISSFKPKDRDPVDEYLDGVSRGEIIRKYGLGLYQKIARKKRLFRVTQIKAFCD